MNLKVYETVSIDRTASVQDILFNLGFITNIEATGTNTKFRLTYGNFRKDFVVNDSYADVSSEAQNYDFGSKIQVDVTKIGNADVNQTMMINVDLIVYAWAVTGGSEIFVAEPATPKIYRTSNTLSQLESKSLLASGYGEKHVMTASQTTINTTIALKETYSIFKNGSLQGFINDLSSWTITDTNVLTYSGASFYGGEEIIIKP